MARSDWVLVSVEAMKESHRVYLGVGYAAYCVGIKRAEINALVAGLEKLVGPLIRWNQVYSIMCRKAKARRG